MPVCYCYSGEDISFYDVKEMQIRAQGADPLGKEYGSGNLLLTDDIARSEHIPKKFLEQILLNLKHAGYVRSKQGSKGGYRLVQDPNHITLAEIYRLFDGAIALVPCVSQKNFMKLAMTVRTRRSVG